MNPNSLAANLLPPQTINKNTNNPMMVGLNLAQTGPQIPPPTILPPTAHAMGPMGEHGIVLQNTSMSSVAPSSITAPQSSTKQSHATPNGGCTPSNTSCGGAGGNNNNNNNNSIQSTATMANMKEKTPMCLVNELARFNKVQHQYRLVDESGPPHKKTFTVVLKLDNEEYTASGPSIKKAQHAAAAIALGQTQMKHPPPKTSRKTLGPITPTVELNALAMKRGEPAVYQLVEPQRPQYIPNLNFRGMYHQRYHYPKTPVYCVSLKVGNRIYFGEGRTSQAARHAAAEEALAVLRNLPCPENNNNHNNNNSNNNLKKPPEPPVPKMNGNALKENEEDDDLKSPISLVHEIALKRGLSVNFEVVRESGPPHMRTFITRCSVGDIMSEGEGNGKKVSKKRAAEKMIEELRKLPPLPPVQQKVKKKPVIKKKNRNLIKEQKADPQYGQGINPISRLIQIQQAKKEREPLYTVIDERGEPRQREFLMQCSLGDISTTGTGPNKKTAKRNAAEAMLQRMGYSRPAVPQTQSKTMKNAGIDVQQHMYSVQDGEKGRKVTFSDHNALDKMDNDGKLGRQLVPGLLLMPDSSGLNPDQNSIQTYQPLQNSAALNRAPGGPIQSVNSIAMQTSAIAKELLDSGVSPTADALRISGHKPVMQHQQPNVRPKQQLLYLADVLGFQARFTDFPKHNEREHFSLVTLTTQPPLIRHGAGPTIEASHDQAALIALRSLAEIGLEAVTDSSKKEAANTNLGSADRIYMAGGQGTAPKLTNSSVPDLGNNPKTGQTIQVAAKDSH